MKQDPLHTVFKVASRIAQSAVSPGIGLFGRMKKATR